MQTKAATAAYLAYTAATFEAERTPAKDHNAQLSKFAIDPALGKIQALLTQLQLAGVANRGTPPTSRLRIKAANLQAQPTPIVTIVDCPTVSPSWVAYDVSTGKPLQVVPNPVKPPYAVTATVTTYQGRWVVSQSQVDRNHTCVP